MTPTAVCPYCDRKFTGIWRILERMRHMRTEHGKGPAE